MIEKTEPNTVITEEEAELYDRQIRLWGLDSQKRLRQAKILIYGLSGLGVEIAKNVILAGVKSLTLMDDCKVTKSDIATNFTLTASDLGKNRAVAVMPNIQKLNPMVHVSAEAVTVDNKDSKFFEQFDVVCIIGCSQSVSVSINKICAQHKIHFISGDCFGFYGYAFFDLGTHEYSEEVQQKLKKKDHENDATGEPESKKQKTEPKMEEETVTVKKTTTFQRLEKSLAAKDTTKKSPGLYDLIKVLWTFKDNHGHLPNSTMSSDKRSFLKEQLAKIDESMRSKSALDLNGILSQTDGEFAPSCAIVGGVIGQEVIKAVSQKDAPLNNFFLFDGTEGSGYVLQLGS